MMESINVVVDDMPEEKDRIIEEDDDQITNHELAEESDTGPDVMTEGPTSGPSGEAETNGIVSSTPNKGPSIRIQKMYPQDNIIGNASEGVTTRSRKLIANACFISQVEPENIKGALQDEYWKNAMQDELNQFARNEV